MPRPKFFLAIDPGTNTVGYALFYLDDKERIDRIVAGSIDHQLAYSRALNNLGEPVSSSCRIHYLVDALCQIVQEAEGTLFGIAMERPFISTKRPKSYGGLYYFCERLLITLERIHGPITLHEYPPITVKHTMGITTSKEIQNKLAMRRQLYAHTELLEACNLPCYLMTEHTVDALAVGYTHMRKSLCP
jgi:Holliday junction resolvasome RuvABC endonuclease subunit